VSKTLDALRGRVRARRRRAVGTAQCLRRVRTAARLLVVDDNKVNRLLLTAQSGAAGPTDVAMAEETAGWRWKCLRREAFDLLLLDMEMPDMDGFQVLEQLTERPAAARPCRSSSPRRWKASKASCAASSSARADYLSKPVNPVLLKARHRRQPEKKRLQDQLKEMVRRFATPEVAQDMQLSARAGRQRVYALVMFSDIRDFTPLAESPVPEETIRDCSTPITH
jgi:CheY-like chemotaxis protein